jgi:hypothetical protein
MTDAVTHELCLQPAADTCNVCGLQMYPICSIFFPGNMWTAQCSYVNQLLPPISFESQMWNVYFHAQQQQTPPFEYDLYAPVDACFGTNRYSSEQWIGSHPTLKPCELSDTGNAYIWASEGHEELQFNFSQAPHGGFNSSGYRPTHLPERHALLRNETARLRNYWLLAGQIHKWYHLYQQGTWIVEARGAWSSSSH